MQFFKKFHMPSPEGKNEESANERRDDGQKDTEIPAGDKDTVKEKKGLKSKLKDALQQWSNDDARDIEEDDSSPLRSGL